MRFMALNPVGYGIRTSRVLWQARGHGSAADCGEVDRVFSLESLQIVRGSARPREVAFAEISGA
jgi:hypothetical protein